MSEAVTPFRVSIDDEQLDDLRARLARSRWPEPAPVPDWSQGVPVDWLRDLCTYWHDGYDWRRCEKRLNDLPQFRTDIDGLGIHFIHVPSPSPSALPLVMTHGWPGSVIEFLDVIGPLSDPEAHGGEPGDAFHVVCPSLPGYGFSDKPAEAGWDIDRIADAWAVLMASLGYDRYGAQGGDWGAAVTTALGERDADHVVGAHINMAMVGPDPDTLSDLTDFEQRSLADLGDVAEWGLGYAGQQGTRPQTLGYGLVDSPVGQCACISEKYWAWTDHARLYWESGWARPSGRAQLGTGGAAMPIGISIFPREVMRPSRRWCEKRYGDIRFYEQPERGGHFAAWEQPELFVDQVRRAFRTMR